MLEGSCWFSPASGPAIQLTAGDVLFMPRGTVHAIGDSPLLSVDTLPDEHEDGPDLGDGTPEAPAVVLLCGAYELRRRRTHALLDAMPDYVHFPDESGDSARIVTEATQLIDWDHPGGRVGDQVVRSAVLDLLMIRVLRRWIDTRSPGLSSAASSDPGIMKVLQHIHDAPAHLWSLAQLATLAGVSRSAFTRRFSTALGMSPLRYVAWWRLNIAARRLRQSDVPLAVIADEVGYGSEFAFAHAFKREFGMAAGEFRRTPSHAEREHHRPSLSGPARGTAG